MDKSSRKIKLLINEFEFLNKQENEVKELFDESQREFAKDINNFLVENGLKKEEDKKKEEIKKKEEEKTSKEDEKKEEGKTSEEKSEEIKDKKKEEVKKVSAPKRYKKMFRQIVSLTHPDKLKKDISEEEKKDLIAIYENTVDNYNDGNYTPLLLNAKKLDIEIGEEFFGDLKTIKNSIDEKNKNISNLQKTFAWIYYNDIEEDEKEDFLKDYYIKYKNKF